MIVHRDVAGARVVLEPVEHRPAVDVGQADVERDRVGLELARQRQRRRRRAGRRALEARARAPGRAGCCAKSASSSTISSDAVARLRWRRGRRATSFGCDEQRQLGTVGWRPRPIGSAAGGGRARRRADRTARRRGAGRRRLRRTLDVSGRIQREGAALARRAARAVISPPSSRAISRLIDRPRPVPPYLRLVVPSACWKASKMICCLSGGMPMPVSRDGEGDAPPRRCSSVAWSGVQPLVAALDRERRRCRAR